VQQKVIKETWAQLHQSSTYSFYARRSGMSKKRQSSQQCHLVLLGPKSVKAARKKLVKLTPCQMRKTNVTTHYIPISKILSVIKKIFY